MKPIDLDQQSPIKIDRWIDIGSEEWKELDDNPAFTKKVLRFGLEDGWLFTDSLGRVWGKPQEPNKPHFPFHFNVGKKLYGYRLPQKAAN